MKYLPTSELKNNIKKEYLDLVSRMNKEDSKVFADSIEVFGVREPVRINENHIPLDGHSRILCAASFLQSCNDSISINTDLLKNLETALKETELDAKKKNIVNEIEDKKKFISLAKSRIKLYEKIPYAVLVFEDKLLEKKYVIESNLQRRHLNNYQKIEIGLKLLEIEKALAKKRKLSKLKQNKKDPPLGSNDPNGITDFSTKGKALDVIAKKVGVSPSMMMRGKKLDEIATDEQKDRLRKGKATVNTMYSHITRESRNLPTVQLPHGKWSCVMVDLPIEFDNSGVRGSSTNNYDTMLIPECKQGIINGQDVRELFADDCVIFAWFQASTIFYAKEILQAWGFKCITNQIWDKNRIGTGTWLANMHEHLVIAVKGKMPVPAIRVSSIVHIKPENRINSSKPKFFYDQTERLYPKRKYLDLFSRYRHNEDWTIFGNDAPNEVIDVKDFVNDTEKAFGDTKKIKDSFADE